MQMFREYPYLNLQDLNLDYILRKIREMQTELNNFVVTNAIKYADPIDWNITTQYEKNTVVIDANSGIAYLSVQPVPSGVAITNTDYWTVIFDLSMFIDKAAKNLTAHVEGQTNTATFNSAAGDWLIWYDILYRAITSINSGDAYVVNSNIEQITIEHIVKEIYAEIINQSTLLQGQIDTINNTSLPAIQGQIDTINNTDLPALRLVDQGILGRFDRISVINIKEKGAVGDGVNDDTSALQAAITDACSTGKAVYIPIGSYLITNTITIPYDKPLTIFGCGNGSQLLHSNNSNLFSFSARADEMIVSDIRITSINTAKSNAYAFDYLYGCYRVNFQNVRYEIDNPDASPSDKHYVWGFFYCPANMTSDTVAFTNCYLEAVDGDAIVLGQGSSVWVTGGRIVGSYFTDGRGTSTGILCQGYMGGVYLTSVDLIWLHCGLHLTNIINACNREFFIVNTTIDGDAIGLWIEDGDASTYMEVTGCWISTSNDLGVYLPTGYSYDPTIKFSNCNFAYCGVYSPNPTGSYAVNINGGHITIADCRFWGNDGTALYINTSSPALVTNCTFRDNYNNGATANFVNFIDNIIIDGSDIIRPDDNSYFEGNVGFTTLVATPTVPAANTYVTNDTGRKVMVSVSSNDICQIYIDGTLVSNTPITVMLRPHEAIALGYTNAPIWKWFEM